MMASDAHEGVLLKGLPFHTDKYSVKEFFDGMDICEKQITVLYFLDGRHSGLAYVHLKSELIQEALSYHCNHMDGRFIEVMPSDEIELHDLQLASREEDMDTRTINRMVNHRHKKNLAERGNTASIFTTCVHISGLPDGSTFKDVRDFFKDLSIGHNCVHLMRHENGTFKSYGYVEFNNSGDCLKALRRNGEKRDESVIQITPCSLEEMFEAIEEDGKARVEKNDLRNTIRESRQQRSVESLHSLKDRTPSPVRRRMRDYAAMYINEREHYDEETRSYRDRSPRQRERHRHSETRDRHGYSKEKYRHGYSEGKDHHGYSKERDRHGYSKTKDHHGYYEESDHLGGRHGYSEARDHHRYSGAREHNKHSDMYEGHSREHDYYQPPPKRQLGPPLIESKTQLYNKEDNGHYEVGGNETEVASTQERRIVRLDSLPYEADVVHIRDFFAEFRLQYEHVRIQCRDDGSPSGKAFVVFPSEQQARDAVVRHNKQYILGRYVELTLV